MAVSLFAASTSLILGYHDQICPPCLIKTRIATSVSDNFCVVFTTPSPTSSSNGENYIILLFQTALLAFAYDYLNMSRKNHIVSIIKYLLSINSSNGSEKFECLIEILLVISYNYPHKKLFPIFLPSPFTRLILSKGKVRSLYSEQIKTDLCAACHAFTLHVPAWGKLKRLCVLVD